MQELIKKIREKLNLSQTELGEQLGVAFSTINRWENGKAYPNKMAQLRIFELVCQHRIPVADMIFQKIQKEVKAIHPEEGRILLYHGSKSGLNGAIKPISRARCDFGRGFYMGTIPEQPLTLICDYEDAKFYVVSMKLENKKILEVEVNLDWAMLVAFNRGRMDAIKGTKLYKKYESYEKEYDVIVGSIADDRMFFVLDNFFQGNITDKALIESLSALKMGEQYVALNEKTCADIRIEKEIELSLLEKKCLQSLAYENREKGVSVANEICKANRREGLYFDEILAAYKEV